MLLAMEPGAGQWAYQVPPVCTDSVDCIIRYASAVEPFTNKGISSPVQVNIAISTGYLISDLLILILYWKVIGDKYFIIHHCTALCAYYFVLMAHMMALYIQRTLQTKQLVYQHKPVRMLFLTLCFLFLIQRYGVLAYIGNFRLLAELSSPFVNQR
ncbi:Transmembrane protein 56 [Camelus dromedarius]|uniref:Transmembrane protein 56 n=1 Tax=Camelus dromedarius TaxID=9838 RepID=A0A5N4DRW9_CAMDR|nr:Transmembrane protein 56 [Camelus dromedarius]